MKRKPRSSPTDAVERLSASLRVALVNLKKAYDSARECRRSPWDFAVELRELQTIGGLSTTDLRWLVSKRYVTHAVEKTKARQQKRIFDKLGGLVFGDKSCFVVTAAGVSRIGADRPEAKVKTESQAQL